MSTISNIIVNSPLICFIIPLFVRVKMLKSSIKVVIIDSCIPYEVTKML